jgi:uncharacterized protein (DUF302 family)
MQVTKTPLTADQAIAALLSGIEAQNMRVVAHINGQANAAKIGKEVPADQILEVFRPDFAVRVWEACKPAGIDIPLRIHVYEEDETVYVAYRTPSEVFEPYELASLMTIARELDVIFAAIVAAATSPAVEAAS